MGKYQLGEFEEIVLLTVGVLYGDAYGVSIKLAIEEKLSRKVSVGALQSALKRLEEKSYLTSKEG
ncbi:MAG: PadR family transcriptional regulator, partial [Bacteroidota bacterium]